MISYKPFILTSVLAVFLTACDDLLCSNDIIKEQSSPDGRYIATLFERDCGATTSYLRIVTLRQTGATFKANKYDDWVFKMEGQPNVVFFWANKNSLSISYSGYYGKAPMFVDSWKNVKIIHN
jgi:uncharacterized protein YxeA